MIRIDRSGTAVPQALIDDGPTATQSIADIITQQGEDALKSSDFDGDVYGSTAVKAALWTMQHHKCCFCEHAYERKFSTVEHFRPKTRVRRSRSSSNKDLGYWWLGYEFENLYFCCSNCNTPKSDYFPLAAGATALVARELASHALEDALILDPGRDEPEDHLTFEGLPNGAYRITPRNGSDRGRETIAAARLDRDDLDELRDAHRRDFLEAIADLFDAAKDAGAAGLEAQVQAMARDLSSASAPFALLARVFFRDRGIL